MNKGLKLKQTVLKKKMRSNKKIKGKSSLISRMPKTKKKTHKQKKEEMKKISSIPVINYNHSEDLLFPDQKTFHFKTKSNSNTKALTFSSEMDSRLMNSISFRNISQTKVMGKRNTTRYESEAYQKQGNNTIINEAQPSFYYFNQLCQRTQNVIKQYKKKQDHWKKEKVGLLKELARYKGKNRRRRNQSLSGLKNIKLH